MTLDTYGRDHRCKFDMHRCKFDMNGSGIVVKVFVRLEARRTIYCMLVHVRFLALCTDY